MDALPQTDLGWIGTTKDVLNGVQSCIPWQSLPVSLASMISVNDRMSRKVNLDNLKNLFSVTKDRVIGERIPHSLLLLIFVVFQNICSTIRRNGGESGLPGSVLYTLLSYIVVLCSLIGSAAVARMLKGVDLKNFDVEWLVCLTSMRVKIIPGMSRVPLHRSLNKNMFIHLGKRAVVERIKKKYVGKNKFIQGRLVKDDISLFEELAKLCAAISPIMHGIGIISNAQLLALYLKVGVYLSKLDADLVPLCFIDFMELLKLLNSACLRLAIGDRFSPAMGVSALTPANISDLLTVIEAIMLAEGKDAVRLINEFVFSGDNHEMLHGNRIVMKYLHVSGNPYFNDIWIQRRW